MVHPVKKIWQALFLVLLDDSPLTQLANVNALVALSSKIPGFNYSPTTDAGGDNTASMTIRGMNSIITGPRRQA